MIYKYKNFVFAISQVVAPSFESFDNSQTTHYYKSYIATEVEKYAISIKTWEVLLQNSDF